MRFRYLLTLLTLAVSLFTVGCRGGKPVVTPEDAAAVGASLSGIVEKATGKMLEAYKAGTVPATVADPFFKAIDEKVLPLSRRARTATAAWHAATEGVPKIKSGEELKAVLADLEREAKVVFGAALPPGIASSIGTIAAELYDAIAKIRNIIAQARANYINWPRGSNDLAAIDPAGNPECILRTCVALGKG
jgi:hypothetical protein